MTSAMALRKKLCTNSSELEDLTDEILIEILTRVPLQTTHLFKCVSKHYLSLISSPFFEQLYRYRHDKKQNFMLVVNLVDNVTRLEYVIPAVSSQSIGREVENCDNMLPISFDFMKRFSSYSLLFVSNDLLLINDGNATNGRNHYICNLMSKKLFKLPPPLPHYHQKRVTIFSGCMCSEDDPMLYKVVFVRYPPPHLNHSNSDKFLEIDVFSSNDECWSKYLVEVPPNRVVLPACNQLYRSQYATICSEKFYWCNHSVVIAYDPFNTPSQCDFIDFPPGFPKSTYKPYKYAYVGNIQGCIRLYTSVVSSSSMKACFWDLEDCNNHVWSTMSTLYLSGKVFTEPVDVLPTRPTLIKGFNPLDGDEVYVVSSSNKLLAVNRRTNFVQFISCVEPSTSLSLFHFSQPSWPTHVTKSKVV